MYVVVGFEAAVDAGLEEDDISRETGELTARLEYVDGRDTLAQLTLRIAREAIFLPSSLFLR